MDYFKGYEAIVSLISAMLVPGIMISACGLLLLGMNNKYSLVVGRIRLLNEEKRKFFVKAGEHEFQYQEEVRLKSIAYQLDRFKFRVKLVRNAVLSYSSAVGCFVITSLTIGTTMVSGWQGLTLISVVFFSIGMILVLTGVSFAARETYYGYKIIEYEIKADE